MLCLVNTTSKSLSTINIMQDMKVKVVGLVMTIVVLKFLLPAVFAGAENTLLVFFQTIQTILATSKSSMTAGFITPR